MGLVLRAKEREIQEIETATSLGGSKATMQISSNVRLLCTRVQMILRQRRRKQKRSVVISAPFNLKCEPVSLPGVSEDEIAMLREKAAASRIGIADPTVPRTPTLASSLFSHPVRPPGRPSISTEAV